MWTVFNDTYIAPYNFQETELYCNLSLDVCEVLHNLLFL